MPNVDMAEEIINAGTTIPSNVADVVLRETGVRVISIKGRGNGDGSIVTNSVGDCGIGIFIQKDILRGGNDVDVALIIDDCVALGLLENLRPVSLLKDIMSEGLPREDVKI